RMGLYLFYLKTVTLAVLSAQTPAFMTAGYISPTPIWAAPSQIITVFISGAKTLLPAIDPEVRAKTLPLPTSLAGFSATVRHGNNTYAAPLISIEQTRSCDSAIDRSSTLWPNCVITAVTLQIPFEIDPTLDVLTDLTVNDNGAATLAFPIAPRVDNIRALTTCDIRGYRPTIPPLTICNGVVSRADGTLVFA